MHYSNFPSQAGVPVHRPGKGRRQRHSIHRRALSLVAGMRKTTIAGYYESTAGLKYGGLSGYS